MLECTDPWSWHSRAEHLKTFSLLLTPSQGFCIFNEGPTALSPSESGSL